MATDAALRGATGETVSGSYESKEIDGKVFVLRIDVDKPRKFSPVLNVISGDLIQDGEVKVHFQSSKLTRTSNVSFNGVGFIYGEEKESTDFSVKIRKEHGVWKAVIQITEFDITHTCIKSSQYFRNADIHIDYSGSGMSLLQNCRYNASSHRFIEPSDDREFTVFSAFEDVGIHIQRDTVKYERVHESDPTTPWTLPELYEAMNTHFDKDPSEGSIWILLAPLYKDPRIPGVILSHGNRKGFALFTGHKWFKAINTPQSHERITDKIKATAMRRFIHTCVHAMGNAFNLQRSWAKGYPDSLSFMNNDCHYNWRNGGGSYFMKFAFSFDEEEIRFLRHEQSIWMQSKVFPPPLRGLPADADGDYRFSKMLKLTIKPSKIAYKQMEAVRLELKLVNDHKTPIYVESNLDPSKNWVQISIKDPNGMMRRVDSLAREVGANHIKPIYRADNKGPDRINEVVSLVYGKGGFYFKTPGYYQIKATYNFGNYHVDAKPVRIEIQKYKGDGNLLVNFFTNDVGEFIALGGSNATRYSKAKSFIKKLAASNEEWALEIVALCAQNLTYSSRKALPRRAKRIAAEMQDPRLFAEEVLESTRPAIDQKRLKGQVHDNIAYRNLAFLRADCYMRKNQLNEANKEVTQMIKDLKSRSVKRYIVREMEMEWKARQGDISSLPSGTDAQRRAMWHIAPPTTKDIQDWVKYILKWRIDDIEDQVDGVVDKEESGLGHRTEFSSFNHKHVLASNEAIKQIYKQANDSQDIIETLGFIHSLQHSRRFNHSVIKYALKMFLSHHALARKNNLRVPELADQPLGVDISTLALVQPTGLPQEKWMDYWRNDAGLVDHHTHWHYVYRGEIPDRALKSPYLDRQGELFTYMHRQMLARYDAERESWGLDPVKAWELNGVPDQLGSYAGDEFHSHPDNKKVRPRPKGVPWAQSDVRKITDWRDNIHEAFEKGMLRSSHGMIKIDITQENNQVSANWAGHIVEATSPIFESIYGSIHNEGHLVFGSLGQKDDNTSYMYTPENAVRDHIFFRWHKFVDNLIEEHNGRRTTELAKDAPDVMISENDVLISSSETSPEGFSKLSGNDWANLHFKNGKLNTAVNLPEQKFEVGKLKHEPFYYHIRIKRAGLEEKELRLTLRIFICPAKHEDDYTRWIEMDKFQHIMAAGERHSVITRPDKHSSVIRRDPQDSNALQEDLEISLARTVTGFCECGWPYNMLLPRGTFEGESYRLGVFISDNSIDSLQVRSSCGSLSYCGARDTKYPDTRQMGYPFATPATINGKKMTITEAAGQLSNFAISTFTIMNRDHRFGGNPPTPSRLPQDYEVIWSPRRQLIIRERDVYHKSEWSWRFRTLIEGNSLLKTKASADEGYIKIRLKGRGSGHGDYHVSKVTIAERKLQSLNIKGDPYEVTFKDGETSARVPEEGLESDPLHMVLTQGTDYFFTFTAATPPVYIEGKAGKGEPCTWSIPNPEGKASYEMNWDLESVHAQITDTRRTIYIIDKIFIGRSKVK